MLTRKETNRIIVHCAYTPPKMNIGMKEIKEWHIEKGYDDVGYHFVIRRDGTVEEGRDFSLVGAHCKGQNSDSIGVCLVGGMSDDKERAEFNITDEQLEALRFLIIRIENRVGKPLEIAGHNQFSSKPCPTFNVPSWYEWGKIVKVEG